MPAAAPPVHWQTWIPYTQFEALGGATVQFLHDSYVNSLRIVVTAKTTADVTAVRRLLATELLRGLA